MRAHLSVLFLALGLALLPAWAATAAPPQPDGAQAPFLVIDEATETFDVPAVALGQPGTAFRYVQTWGDLRVPYFDDPNHLDEPTGLATDGTNVWIAESVGRRLTKFGSDGTFLLQIGKSGLRHTFPATVQGFTDVAVDAGGNIWATDWAHHVLQFDSNGAYVKQLFSDWNSGQGNNQFNTPYGLAFDSAGRLYVSDMYNHRIQVFQADGTYLATIGVTGQAGADNLHFNEPRHIVIDSSNRLYVADSRNHRIQILNAAGFPTVNHIATIGVSGVSGGDNAHLNTPSGVAVDISRGRIYVSDGYNWRVQVFDYATRVWQATLPDGSFTDDVAVDAAGNLYITKPWGDQHIVKQFDSSLTLVRTYGSKGVPYLTDPQHYYQPSGIAVALDGSMYISEAQGRRLTKLGPTGAAQWTVGAPGNWGSDNSHFSYGRNVDLDSQGRVYLVDEANCRVQVYNPTGLFYATVGAGPDQCGSGNGQFNRPRGVALGPGDTLYVADSNNHRVQVFDANRNYVATIGATGVAGSDNGHFNYPVDVDVDSDGTIYVVDHNNHRLQVFNSSRAYVRTIGVSGVAGDDFGHLRNPTAVVVGAGGRTFVTSSWGDRIHIFDGAGAYLTTIGGSYGERTGQLRDANGLALDADGNLYVAESENHRVQKFAPGVPGWKQVNINGFGDRQNRIATLAPFSGQLYAGTYQYSGNGAQLWRMGPGGTWSAVQQDGFGDATNIGIDHLVEFKGNFYAGTWNSANNPPTYTTGGQLWRSPNGSDWTQVVDEGFGDPTNGEVFRLGVFKDMLYATTSSYTNTHGSEVWRSATGDADSWQRVVTNGFGDANNDVIGVLSEYNGDLYASTWRYPLGGQVWRSPDGETWNQVSTDGFGSADNFSVWGLVPFQGHLYAGTANRNAMSGVYAGGQVWRCAICDGSDWQQIISGGFGDTGNVYIYALSVFHDRLYAVAYNWTTGTEVWRTSDGNDWEQVNPDGFGDSNNGGTYFSNATAVFNNRFFIGTGNSANGGEIWQKTVTADFSAIPRWGSAPLVVNFTDESAGDVTSREWDFGDGSAGSTLANPTHEYLNRGLYTVSLTVSDGLDEDTVTRAAYIDTRRRLYLPLVMQNYTYIDPYLYDDFNNPAYDASYDPAKWRFDGENTQVFQVRQENGRMMFRSSASSAASSINMRIQSDHRSWAQVQLLEAKLALSSDRTGSWPGIRYRLSCNDINGHGFDAACFLYGAADYSEPHYHCWISGASEEYTAGGLAGAYDTLHTFRIEADPTTAEIRFYWDGSLIGSHVPNDAAALLGATNCRAVIKVTNDPDSTATRYVDDVRITPAQ